MRQSSAHRAECVTVKAMSLALKARLMRGGQDWENIFYEPETLDYFVTSFLVMTVNKYIQAEIVIVRGRCPI